MTDMTSGLENKAGGDPDTLLGELMGAFEEFKRTNEERLVKIEKGRTPDALITDKLERINAMLTAPRRRSTAPRWNAPGRGSKPASARPAMTSTRRPSHPM